eukprot:CAMPEP_0167779652 /NCGR_PEP_ID=MMETSP0111_2-20121227/4922_1 /TAXON_ID=91324 /ORGANISM="Lotharella globosa, Strain CCCM811" /LENGTH=315 /DNA_ID=CAMNT_0007670079 /DNA_START=54 /DNA_END=1001 /DNA_ORIENTATION=+
METAFLASAFRTAEILWPEAMAGAEGLEKEGGARRLWMRQANFPSEIAESFPSLPLWLFAKLRQVMPIIRGPLDAVVLARLFVQEAKIAKGESRTSEGGGTGYRPVTAGEVNTNFDKEMLQILQLRYKVKSQATLEIFHFTMDEWRKQSLSSFTSGATGYLDVVNTIKDWLGSDTKQNVHIVTDQRKVDIMPVLKDANLNINEANVRGRSEDDLSSGDVIELIHKIAQDQTGPEAIMYIDGKAGSLIEAAEDERLTKVSKYFVTWGPSTIAQEMDVRQIPGVTILDDVKKLEDVLEGRPLAQPSQVSNIIVSGSQ